jgi:hypothetical protein
MNALDRLFVDIWDAFLNGVGIDEAHVENLLERTGLAEYRPATEVEIANHPGWELELGDTILALTERGCQVVREARQVGVK